ncbi:cation diffusion facilitator family transporter [Alteromonas lipolytica]
MHAHSHHHHHHPHDDNADSKRIGWAFWLNFIFTVIEFVGGWLTNSVAIMADAVHDLGDCMSIGLAWVLSKLGKKQATQNYSYGFKRFSLMGAMINAVILMVGSVWILSEAIPRLFDPQMPMTEGMIGLAILGVAVNGAAAWKLHGGHTLNEKVLNWHLLEDMLGWIAVLIVAIVLHFVEWPILDPILSILFTLFILSNVVRYATQTVRLFMQASPDVEQREKMIAALKSVDYVSDIHDVHFWSLDGEQHVLTAHLVLDSHVDSQTLRTLKDQVSDKLDGFSLQHTTIEFEFPGEPCRDEDGPDGSDVPHDHAH